MVQRPLMQRDSVRLLIKPWQVSCPSSAGAIKVNRSHDFSTSSRRPAQEFSAAASGVRLTASGPSSEMVTAKKEPTRIVCNRHHASIPPFARFRRPWYLVVEPTYHFTADGEKPSRYRESYLSGLKRLEKHQAVSNNFSVLVALSHVSRALFDTRRELIAFATAEHFSLDSGIPDADWLRNADADEREHLGVDKEPTDELVVDDDQQLTFAYEA